VAATAPGVVVSSHRTDLPASSRAEFAWRVRETATVGVVAVLALLTLLWVLEQLRGLIVLVVFSLFLAFAIEPAVDRLARRGWSRGQATAAIYLLLLGVAGAFAAIMGTLVARQVAELVDALPGYSHQVADYLESELGVDISSTDVARTAGRTSDLVGSLVGGAFGLGATVLGVLFQVLTVATLTFFFAKDGPKLRRAVCSLLPAAKQEAVLRAWEIAIDRTAGYVYYRSALALVSAVVHAIAFTVLDVPFAVTLAIWVGLVSQFIPTIGTYLAGTLPIAVALGESPRTALLTLAFIVVYQQVENYILSPPLSAHTMRIHPALGLVAAIAGVALVGPIGALLALPVVATAQSVVSVYLTRHEVVPNELVAVDELDDEES
jgi:predicted PurR-regulated permease PerM